MVLENCFVEDCDFMTESNVLDAVNSIKMKNLE